LNKSWELTKFVVVLNLSTVDIILQVYRLGEKINVFVTVLSTYYKKDVT